MIGALIGLVAFVVIFGLPIGAAFFIGCGSAGPRQEHYTGRRRDGSIGQITASRRTRWE